MMITMKALPIIIKTTLQREYRSKTILLMLGFTIIGLVLVHIFLTFVNPATTPDATEPITQENEFNLLSTYALNAFVILMNGWCVLISAMIGSNAFLGDEESGLIGTILSFPITRETYVLGRFIGIWLVILFLYLASYSLAISIFSYHTKSLIVGWEVFHSLFYLSFTVWGIVILSSFMGLFMPRIFAVFAALIANAVYGQVTSSQLRNLNNPDSDLWVSILSYVFPRVSVVGDIGSFVLNTTESATEMPFNLWIEIPHFLVASFFWVVVIIFLVKKRDY